MGAATRRVVGTVALATVLTGACAVGYAVGSWSQGGGDDGPATRAVVVEPSPAPTLP